MTHDSISHPRPGQRIAQSVVLPRRHVALLALLTCVPLPLFSLMATIAPLPSSVARVAASVLPFPGAARSNPTSERGRMLVARHSRPHGASSPESAPVSASTRGLGAVRTSARGRPSTHGSEPSGAIPIPDIRVTAAVDQAAAAEVVPSTPPAPPSFPSDTKVLQAPTPAASSRGASKDEKKHASARATVVNSHPSKGLKNAGVNATKSPDPSQALKNENKSNEKTDSDPKPNPSK